MGTDPGAAFDADAFPDALFTPSWSFYPGFASADIRTPAPAERPGTTTEFVGKGIGTGPRVTGNPAPYPVGVLSTVL